MLALQHMLLTLVVDESTTQADSLRPKEYNLFALFLLDLCDSCQLKETASLNYQSCCGKSQTSTSELACLYRTVRRVVN